MTLAKTEDGLLVEFYTDATEVPAESEKKGRPIFQDQEFVKIIVPGDNRTEIVRLATDQDRERFEKPYQLFQKQGQKSTTGTPLEEWPLLSKSQVAELKGMGFRTVESVSHASEATRGAMPLELRSLQTQAGAYLAQATDASASSRLAGENDRLKGEVSRLEGETRRLAEQVRKMEADANKPPPQPPSPVPRGPGRPRLEREDA